MRTPKVQKTNLKKLFKKLENILDKGIIKPGVISGVPESIYFQQTMTEKDRLIRDKIACLLAVTWNYLDEIEDNDLRIAIFRVILKFVGDKI